MLIELNTTYRTATRMDFKQAIESADLGDRSAMTGFPEHGELFMLSNDRQSGFCLEVNGAYLSGVFSASNGRLPRLLHNAETISRALGNSAMSIDCFAPLAPIYARHGFIECSRQEWNWDFAPNNWPESLGTPDVVYMKKSLVSTQSIAA